MSEANKLMHRAKIAGAIFNQLDQAHVDKIVKNVCEAAFNKRVELAKMAVEETNIGIWEHKVIKNVLASQLIYHHIKDEKTAGIIHQDDKTGITHIAQPLGPILAITPTTNPTSTVIFKILICLKSRNPIVICPHPRSVKCCVETARICYEAALAADAPEDCIQIVNKPSMELSGELMHHPDLALILATGGPGLVKAAYSSGTPAIGVGPGNVPVMIEESADPAFAVKSIITSKTFDNGTICASEQAVITTKKNDSKVKKEFEKQNCYFLKPEEINKIEKVAFDPKTGLMNAAIVGQSAEKIAKLADIKVPKGTKILLAQLAGIGDDFPLSHEILAPILAYYVCDSFADGTKLCIDINHLGGLGHTVSIYSNDQEKIEEFASTMDAGRIVVNTPSSQGAVGGLFNTLPPSLTLGCGAGGKNITMENVSAKHLINIKNVCRRRDNQRFFDIPTDDYLNPKHTFTELEQEFNKNK